MTQAWQCWINSIHWSDLTVPQFHHIQKLLRTHPVIRQAWQNAFAHFTNQRKKCTEDYERIFAAAASISDLDATFLGKIKNTATALDPRECYNTPSPAWSVLGWPLWKRVQVYAETMYHEEPWPSRDCQSSNHPNIPASYVPASVVEALVRGAHALLLNVMEHQQSHQEVLSLLRDPVVAAQFFFRKEAVSMLTHLIKKYPAMTQWRDQSGNTFGHYMVALRGDWVVSQSLVDVLLDLDREWFFATNDAGHSLRSLIANRPKNTSTVLAYLDKKLVHTTLRKDGVMAQKSKQAKQLPLAKRKM